VPNCKRKVENNVDYGASYTYFSVSETSLSRCSLRGKDECHTGMFMKEGVVCKSTQICILTFTRTLPDGHKY